MNDFPHPGDLAAAVRHLRDGGTPQDRYALIERFDRMASDQDLPPDPAALAHLVLALLLIQPIVLMPMGGGPNISGLSADPPTVTDLSEEWLRGGLENSCAAGVFLRLARERLRAMGGADGRCGRDLLVVRGLSALMRIVPGVSEGGPLDQAIEDLTEAVAGLSERHVLYPRLANGLGVAKVMRGSAGNSPAELKRGRQAADEVG